MENTGDFLQKLNKLDHPKLKCIEEIAKQRFQSKNRKFNAEALSAFADIIKVFIAEAAARSAMEAKKDADENSEIQVTNEHLEKILPQINTLRTRITCATKSTGDSAFSEFESIVAIL